jgi:hypothetical protein
LRFMFFAKRFCCLDFNNHKIVYNQVGGIPADLFSLIIDTNRHLSSNFKPQFPCCHEHRDFIDALEESISEVAINLKKSLENHFGNIFMQHIYTVSSFAS